MIETTKKIAEMLKALGHPARVEILRFLSANRDARITVTQIQEMLGLTQSVTSRHLIVLKNASILHCGKSGVNVYYSVNEQNPIVKQLTLGLRSDG